MSDVKWIKIVTDIFSDEKIIFIKSLDSGDEITVIWFQLLCLAGKLNKGGQLLLTDAIALNTRMLADIFRRSEDRVKYAIDLFCSLGMIEDVDGVITITNWNKYQDTDKLQKMQEQNKNRQQRFRDNHKEEQKQCSSNVTVTLPEKENNVTVTQQNKNKNKKENKNKNNKSNNMPPTLEDVKAYCKERENNVDPEAFIDYYEARGWYLSNGKKMVDWKAAVRTWERNNYGNHKSEKVGKNGVALGDTPEEEFVTFY